MTLQRPTRARFHLMQDLTQESNFLMTNLYLKFSDYTITGPFKQNKLSATSLAVMEKFVSELISMPLDRLIEFLVLHGKNRFDDPEEVARSLQKAARSSYRLPESMTDSVNLAMASSIRVIHVVQKQRLTIIWEPSRKRWTRFRESARYLPSGILSEVDINDFRGQQELAKYGGLAWNQNQSGKFTAKRTRLVHSGNHYLKHYLLEAANSFGCTTLFMPSTMLKNKRTQKNLPIKVPLRLQLENWCG
ncbi:transposase [Lentibacillus salinarum]|uniref:Transposase n=1 Tax=Lentibacillus salinarum TaxID=446820 RepID=A0ABW3ZZD4_9BACI